MVEDGLAKTLTVFGIRNRHVQRATGHAHALRCNADAPTFQPAQSDAIALALFANQVLGGNAAVVEIDLRGVAAVLAQLVFESRHHIARRIGGHQERAHALLACALVGDRNHDGHVAILAAGDELLDAVNDVLAAFFHRRGPQAGGIAAYVGLCQAEGPQHPTLSQRLQPLLLLLRIAELHQDGIDRAVGHADHGTGAAVTRCNFFQYQCQRQVIQPRTTQLFGHANTVDTQRGQPLVHILGKVVLLIPARGVGPQLSLRKVTHRVAHHFLVLGQQH